MYSTATDAAWTDILSNNGEANTRENLRTLFPGPGFIEKSRFTLLHRTVLELNLVKLDILVDSLSRSAINESDTYGRTALFWAARRGDSSTVSLLLKYGADPNKRTPHGNSPLNTAIASKHEECARLLLDFGCEIRDRTTHGWIPLHNSCYCGSDIDIVEKLLDGGVYIDCTTLPSRMTPLIIAAQENHIHIVKYLISQGADLNAADHNGECSLHVATSYNCPEVLRLLLQHKASHRLGTKAGETLLHYAAQYGNIECLEVLLLFSLEGINPENRITGISPTQRFKVKGLTAIEIAELRTDVSPEWRVMFRTLVHGIRFPGSKSPLRPPAEEIEEFEDALETQE